MLSKLVKAILLSLLAFVCIGMPVLAAYSANLSITEGNGNSYDMVGLRVDAPFEWLADNDYIDSDALDTRVETIGGTYKPWLVTEDKVIFASAVPADSQTNLLFTTDNAAPPTAMNIVTGYGGYITVTDHASLELGDDFDIELDTAYINTDAGGTKPLVYKNNSFQLTVSAEDEITAEMLGDNYPIYYDTGNDDSEPVGDNWGANDYDAAQSFTTGDAFTVTRVDVYMTQSFVGNDSFTLSIREMGANPTSNAALTTGTGTVVGGTNWITFDVTDYALSATTQYVLVFYNTAGDDSWVTDETASAYGGGTFWTNDNDAGWAENATWDGLFRVFCENPAVTATGLASDEYDILVSADGTDMTLYIDSGLEDTASLLGMTMPDNANNWLIMNNGTTDFMSYMTSYTHTISSTEVISYEPADIIVDAGASGTLPDLTDNGEGDQDGTITWGSNPAGITLSLGSLVSTEQPIVGETIEDPSRDLLPEVETSDWFEDPGVGAGGALLTNPLRPFVTMVSDNTTLSELLTWRLLGLAIVVLITITAAKMVPKHLAVACFAGGAATIALVSFTIWPLWALVILVLYALGGWVSERSPSI